MKYPNITCQLLQKENPRLDTFKLTPEQLQALKERPVKTPKKLLIYVISFNDESEQIARDDFGSYTWAKIYRLKKQTELFESIMYKDELMDMYDEWKDMDYVGTISYSYFRKYPKNKIYLLNKIDNLERPFHGLVHPLPDPHYHNDKMKEYMTTLLNEVGLKPSNSWIFCNYWCCTPLKMKEYISWFTTVSVSYTHLTLPTKA